MNITLRLDFCTEHKEQYAKEMRRDNFYECDPDDEEACVAPGCFNDPTHWRNERISTRLEVIETSGGFQAVDRAFILGDDHMNHMNGLRGIIEQFKLCRACGKPVEQDYQCPLDGQWLGTECIDCHTFTDTEDLAND